MDKCRKQLCRRGILDLFLGQLEVVTGAVRRGQAFGNLLFALRHGCQDRRPYVLHAEPHEDDEGGHLADLEEGGRILAWIGDTISKDEIEIGMPLQVVPRIFEEVEEIKVYYSLEKPGTTWGVVPPS